MSTTSPTWSHRVAAVAATVLLAGFLAPLGLSTPARADAGDGRPGTPRADASQLSLGDNFGCAIVTDGSVRCWGNNSDGTMVQGNTDDVGDDPGESTVRVPLPAPAKALAAGDQFACAILDTGQLRCWGDAVYGALAQGDENDVGDQPGETPVLIDLGAGRTAVAVSAGQQHACAILDTGQVRCWGNNAYGQLAQGFSSADIGAEPGEIPVLVNLPRPAVAIASADWSNCAILDNGEIRCWGAGYAGQLMQGNANDWGDDPGETTPVRLAIDPRTALAITGGGSHYCAIYDDHRPRCWGESTNGELGLGRTTPFGDEPGELSVGTVDLPSGRTATAAAGGEDNTCAILDDGQLHCWGLSTSGQLGQGNTTTWGDNAGESTLAVDVGGPVRAVAVGENFVCAVTDTGLRCWGDNENGRLGWGGDQPYGGNPGELPKLLPAIDLGGQLVGRDTDGDGVRDAADVCPTAAGILPNGCTPEALLKGKKVVLDTVMAKTKASAKCPAKATVKVKTKTKKGKLTVTKQLKTKTVATGCAVKGKVKLSAKPKKSAKTKVKITGTKLKTKRLVAVRA
jgi:hypothetical protein